MADAVEEVRLMATPNAEYVRSELVATALTFCTTHSALGHETLAWRACRFKQLFYLDPEPADPWDPALTPEQNPPDWDEPQEIVRLRAALEHIGRCCGNSNFVANRALGYGHVAHPDEAPAPIDGSEGADPGGIT